MSIPTGGLRRTVHAVARVCNNETEGTEMFSLIVFGAVLVVLVAATGLPYPQTWHGRFGD
jgi:hypothetical protein